MKFIKRIIRYFQTWIPFKDNPHGGYKETMNRVADDDLWLRIEENSWVSEGAEVLDNMAVLHYS
jgi:hypothetical protein